MSVQRNVHQQNELQFQALLATAIAVRSEGVPHFVAAFLRERGIEPSKCAFVEVERNGFMLGLLNGFRALLVTPEQQFFEIELEANASSTEVVHVHAFTNVTGHQNVSLHNPGTGKGTGALALAVLQTLNAP